MFGSAMHDSTASRWAAATVAAVRRLSVAGGFGGAALFVILAVAALLGRGQGGAAATNLADYVESNGRDPADLVAGAARAHRFVFLSDIDGAETPKRIAADAIRAVAENAGLDAVVLDVPETEQATIDAYLRSDPEDVAILLGRPATLRGRGGTERAYLEIYRTVWQLNQDFGAVRSIRVIAAGLPDSGTPGPRRAGGVARALESQDEHMANRLNELVLERNPHARVLVFADGFRGLRSGRGVVHLSGGGTIEVEWLARRLAQEHPGDVYTILIDGVRIGMAEPGAYTGTRAAEPVGRRLRGRRVAVRIDEHFDYLKQPLHERGGPGFAFEIRPRDYHLRDVADAYIYAGGR